MENFVIPSTGSDVVANHEHSPQIWDNHRKRITELYSDEKRSLSQVIAVMENEYGFRATQRQYKTRISLWHLDKNIKDSEIRFMAQTQAKRAFEDKETNFRVRGRDVDPEKISRAVKRKKISNEELLTMAAAPTPSDISYDTPSAVNPLSPYAQQPAVQDRDQMLYSSPNHAPVQSSWHPSEWQNQASFSPSFGNLSATPIPVEWYGPSTSVAPDSFQTPPGILQSPVSLWNTGFVDGMLDNGNDAAYTDHLDIYEIKYARLVELLKETEETESIDYMKSMSEVNSLVYDLITFDQSKSEMIVEKSSAHSPKCCVCRALEEIGRETMASKVESERVILEAIAISEGRFGEEHGASFHFRVSLAFLYNNWSCRNNSSYLSQIVLLASRKAPTINGEDILSELLDPPKPNRPIRCTWLQAPAWESFLATSSHQLSTLSIRGETIRDSPRSLWGLIETIFDRFDFSGGPRILEFEPILDLILCKGSESVDGCLYFWIVTFISAIHKLWGPIFNSRYLISNTAIRDSLSGSVTLKATLEQLCENPYRLVQPAGIAVNGEGGSDSRSSDRLSIARDHARFDDITKLEGPLENLNQLRLVLAELSLSELEKLDCSEVFAFVPQIIGGYRMLDTLCSAAELGNSNLIKQFGMHFGKADFNDCSLTDFLNLSGEVEEWGFCKAPLCSAARAGHQLTIETLINIGADPDGPEDCDESPICLAADSGFDEIVGLLVKRGAFFVFPSVDVGVLTCIIKSSDQEVHEKWLGDVSDYRDLLDLLFAIVLIGDIEKYELFGPVSERIREHCRSTENKTLKLSEPILRSILDTWERRKLQKFLADVDESGRGLELVLNALTGDHIEQQAREILKTTLFGSEAALTKMLDPGKSSGSSSSSDQLALHTLVSRNAPNALGVFLQLGPNCEASDEQGNTALHIAAARNRIACAQQLLKHGIDVYKENMNGETALQIAVRAGHTEISEEIGMPIHMFIGDEGDDLVI